MVRSIPILASAMLFVFGGATSKASELPPGFSRLSDIAPGIAQDMRYAGAKNFTGKPVPGYKAPQCWLRTDAAKALARAQTDAQAHGFDLVVYDCYRPKRAVAAFVDWSRNADQSTKSKHYPRIEKRELFPEGYIAENSTHTTGLAVDLGVKGWNFGTPFDYFDKSSWTKSPIRSDARRHRDKLVALMKRHGFANYPREWWHFTYKGVEGATSYNAEIE